MTQSNNSKIQTRPIEDLIGRIRTPETEGRETDSDPSQGSGSTGRFVDSGDDTYGNNTGRDHRGIENCQRSTDGQHRDGWWRLL